jgi:hypothetical protein
MTTTGIVRSTCNGHGTCSATGACQCATGYVGTSCAACAANYYNYPACTYCDATITCSGHGSCGTDGSCVCDSGSSGTDCASMGGADLGAAPDAASAVDLSSGPDMAGTQDEGGCAIARAPRSMGMAPFLLLLLLALRRRQRATR